jgi:P-type E1-E2 ATPase
VNSLTRAQILEFLVTMEEKASHPVAQAIVMAATNEGVVKNKELVLTDHKILNGEGVEGNVNGKKVYIGNDRLFLRLGLNVPTTKTSSGYMSIEGYGVVCSFTAADSVRPEAAEVIASLKLLGVESIMLTGDNEAAARFVGDKVGLSLNKVKSRLLPEDKYRLVKEMVEDPANRSCRTGGRLMMIGDGVNDAPALAIGTYSVSDHFELTMSFSRCWCCDGRGSRTFYGNCRHHSLGF